MAIQTATKVSKSFAVPDQVMEMGGARIELVQIGEIAAKRVTVGPGWRWTSDMKALAGTDLCQVPHVAYLISGRLGVSYADGSRYEFDAGSLFVTPPGHDGYVIGDEPATWFELADTSALLDKFPRL